jgi:hypothetical protein
MSTAQTVNIRTTFNSSIWVTPPSANQNSKVYAGYPGQTERNTPYREAVRQVCSSSSDPHREAAYGVQLVFV